MPYRASFSLLLLIKISRQLLEAAGEPAGLLGQPGIFSQRGSEGILDGVFKQS